MSAIAPVYHRALAFLVHTPSPFCRLPPPGTLPALGIHMQSSGGGSDIAALIPCFIYLAVFLLVVIGLWKVFEKAGQPGWAAIIPVVNLYFLCKVAGRPGWWVILYLI